MKTESQELARLLQEYERSATAEKRRAAEVKFNDIYAKMLMVHESHLKHVQVVRDLLIDKTMKELTD